MKMVAFLSLCRVNQFVLWGKQTRDKEEGKKSSNKAERGDKAPTRNALALSLSLCVCVLLFSKQTSLSSTSLLLLRVGETNGALTHNTKEEAKKLEHKSGGVKKHEQRNCSLNLRSFLSSVVFSVLFRANRTRLFHQCPPWRSPQSLNEGPLFPTINIKHLLE